MKCPHLGSPKRTWIGPHAIEATTCEACLRDGAIAEAASKGWTEYRKSGLKADLSIDSLDQLDGFDPVPGFYFCKSERHLSLLALHLASRPRSLQTTPQEPGLFLRRSKSKVSPEVYAYRPKASLVEPLKIRAVVETTEVQGLESDSRMTWNEADFPGCLVLSKFGSTTIEPKRPQTGAALRRYATALLSRSRAGRWTLAVRPDVLPEWIPSELRPLFREAV